MLVLQFELVECESSLILVAFAIVEFVGVDLLDECIGCFDVLKRARKVNAVGMQ